MADTHKFLILLFLVSVLAGCDSLDGKRTDSENFQLTIAATPESLLIGEFSSITATLSSTTTTTGSTTTTPVPGFPVTFTITQNVSGCTITVVNSITDSSGKAGAIYKAGTVAGIDVIQASIENGTPASVGILVKLK